MHRSLLGRVLRLALLIVLPSAWGGVPPILNAFSDFAHAPGTATGGEPINLAGGPVFPVGKGSHLKIFDANGMKLGEIKLKGKINSIVAHPNGNPLYVFTTKGMSIVDISDPSTPLVVFHLSTLRGVPTCGQFIPENAAHPEGLLAIGLSGDFGPGADICDLATLALLPPITDIGNVNDMALFEIDNGVDPVVNHLLVASSTGIYDHTYDPVAEFEAALSDSFPHASGFTNIIPDASINPTHLYFSQFNRFGSLAPSTLDIEGIPVTIFNRDIDHFTLAGIPRVYVSALDRLNLYDMSNLSSVQLVDFTVMDALPRAIRLNYPLMSLTTVNSGFELFDFTDPFTPEFVFGSPGLQRLEVALTDTQLYTADGSGGVTSYFLPGTPTDDELAALNAWSVDAFHLFVDEVLGYAATPQGLTVFNPNLNQVIHDDIDLFGLPSGVNVQEYPVMRPNGNGASPERFAFVATSGGVEIVNVIEETDLSIEGTFSTAFPNIPQEVDVEPAPGNPGQMICYVAAAQGGVLVLNVTNPASPEQIGTASQGNIVFDVKAAGNRLYVAEQFAALHIFDVTDPTSPEGLGMYFPSAIPFSVNVSGEIAFITTFNDVLALDCSDPASIELISQWPTYGNANFVSTNGELVAVADNSNGALVLSLGPRTARLDDMEDYFFGFLGDDAGLDLNRDGVVDIADLVTALVP